MCECLNKLCWFFQHDVAPIRVWLWVYSTVYILFIIVGVADVIGYIGMQDTKTKQLLISKIVTTTAYGGMCSVMY